MVRLKFIKKLAQGSALAACGLFAATGAQAQVLGNPNYYSLPALNNTLGGIPSEGMPITLNAGDIESSIVTDIGNATLNDVAIMGIEGNPAPQGGSPDALGRVWSLVHTSGSDTQALAVATPVDVPLFFADPNTCYQIPSSVQILDLDGDDTNDLAFISSCEFTTGPGFVSGNVYGLQGNSSAPFQDSNSLTVLGSQLDGAFFPPLLIGSQPSLAAGDYDGDGLTDLGFYDADATTGPQAIEQIHTLLNDGVLANLPDVLSTIDGPVVPPTFPGGILVESGLYDGDDTLDFAILFLTNNVQGVNNFKVYSGNGDGSFNQSAFIELNVGENVLPTGLASGDFDGNGSADFAISVLNNQGGSTLVIVTCDAGAVCNQTSITSPDPEFSFTVNDTADFNGDGSDDLVTLFTNFPIANGPFLPTATVQLRLSQNGGFNATPDQTFPLDTSTLPEGLVNHLVAQDIDGCGGPDLAYTGVVYDQTQPQPPITFGRVQAEYQAGVAFNPNEAPVADAGPDNGTRVASGIQIGGNPTCSDPTNDVMEITWTQVSGQSATLNDATAANPIITSASGTADAVFQVTCTDACGLSDSDTVTIDLGLIQGSGTCSLNSAASGFSAAWLMIPAALGFMGALRRKKS